MKSFKSLICFSDLFLERSKLLVLKFEFMEDFGETTVYLIEFEPTVFIQLHDLFFYLIDMLMNIWKLLQIM